MQPINAVRTYPVQCETMKDGTQRIKVLMSPGVKKMKRAVYMFHSTKSEQRLIGATTTLRERIYKYHTDINSGKKTNSFLDDIRKKPDDFKLSVLEVVSPDVKLGDREKFHIKRLNTFKKGYNSNRGGGGSFGVSRVSKVAANVISNPVFKTPSKRYRFQRAGKGVRVDFGGSPTKHKKRVIYSILEDGKLPALDQENQAASANAAPTKHQIGLTTQPISRRISQHVHIINNPKHLEAHRDIYERIRENPEAFAVAVMHEAQEGEDLAELERTFIKSKPLVFNKNKGGGGIPGNR
ncbi:GIY-YIG nuclease family protein [Estrella lausannensis]|uniref:Putative endonuclease n=1 Tax=Estrella lausannensis TaxID=483423 RepID=A0A0H5DQH5_9BACT|nr:GIY-YIG nuclease family protein [Estrella lausannensis]CRX38782.1 Putative endonuclease [Estrella lausannensis]